MKPGFKRLGVILVLVLLTLPFHSAVPLAADPEPVIPVKVALLIDNSNPEANTSAYLYRSVEKVLKWNKLPFEALDISAGQHPGFLDASGNPKYSALAVLAQGAAIDSTNSESIVAAVNKGMGAVAMLPGAVNKVLKEPFGVSVVGSVQKSAQSLKVVQDKFTLAYAGASVDEVSNYLNHTLLAGADIVATFPTNEPAVWTYSYGAGKTVFHNTSATSTLVYQGILFQSILYAMPIGVACPVNAGAFEVDDCPMTYYTADYIQWYYYDFMTNIIRWLDSYNISASFFLALSYSGDISDFWTNPESLQCSADILRAASELGLHCGSAHEPLDKDYWGGNNGNVDAEVDKTMQSIQLLRERLQQEHQLSLGEVISYVAPMNQMSDYGYQALDNRTGIKYVGTAYAPAEGGAAAQQAALDKGRGYLLSGNNTERQHRPRLSFKDKDKDKGDTSQQQLAAYSETFRDFGWEGNLYNLPRIQGGFYVLTQPQSYGYSITWNLFRTMVESGQPYLTYTHPPEADIDRWRFPDITMAGVFNAYSTWANFAATRYPFYRWFTATQLGDYLTSRTGVLGAQWYPTSGTLQLTLAQPDDAIRVKTDRYLQSITVSGNIMTLAFVTTPTDFQSDQYDVVRVGKDYFIYPLGSRAFMPVVSDPPFVFQPAKPNRPPVLDPVGNKQVIRGQFLTFTISGSDPDGDPLTYSASNLSAGASFDPATRTFSWTPTTVGVYPSIRFTVSDSQLTDYEDITITVVEALPPTAEIRVSVAAGADDGFSGTWGYYRGTRWYEVGNPGAPYNAWFRFTGITLPQGATIIEARLETEQRGWASGAKLKIRAEKAASPTAPTSTADHNNRVRTTAGVDWTSGYGDWQWHSSPDIAAVIQEMVNTYDYSKGGTVQVLVDNNGSTSGSEALGGTFEDGRAPRLYIKYQ